MLPSSVIESVTNSNSNSNILQDNNTNIEIKAIPRLPKIVGRELSSNGYEIIDHDSSSEQPKHIKAEGGRGLIMKVKDLLGTKIYA